MPTPAKKNNKNNPLLIPVIILSVVVVLLLGLVAYLFATDSITELNHKDVTQNSVAYGDYEFDEVESCFSLGGAVLSLNPRECVSYEGVKGVDHSIETFDECIAALGEDALIFDTNPIRCHADDGRVFFSETMYP